MCNTFNNFMGFDALNLIDECEDELFSEIERIKMDINPIRDYYENKKKTPDAEDKQDKKSTGEESSCESEESRKVSEETCERKRRENEEDAKRQEKFLYETGVIIRKRLEEAIEENDDFPEESYITISLVKNEVQIRVETRDDLGNPYESSVLSDWLCEAFFDEVKRFGWEVRSGVSSDAFGPYFFIQKVHNLSHEYSI